jgi:peptidoglycan/LPS O-acetylase OafA/YrhL
VNVVAGADEKRSKPGGEGARESRIYIPTLDGWRALAIAAVICFHGEFSFFPDSPALRNISEYGYLGVDTFFAISGFLICSILLGEYAGNQRIDLKKFYIRRFFRIIPPYLAALAGIVLVAWLGCIHLQPWEIPSCLLFFRNYEPSIGSTAGSSYDPYGLYTAHFWSLAVEEHFYLIWAPLLAFLKPRRAIKAAFILAAAVCLWRLVDAHYGIMHALAPATWAGQRTDSRLDALLWGCLTALFFPQIKRIFAHRLWSWAWIPMLVYLVVLERYHLPLLTLQLALLFPCLLMSTVLFPKNALGRLLELPFMRWIGALSYSLYLWQELFLQPSRGPNSLERTSGFYHLQQWPWNLIAILICACGSHYLLEKPMIRLGRRFTGSSASGRPGPAQRATPAPAEGTKPAFDFVRSFAVGKSRRQTANQAEYQDLPELPTEQSG